MKARKEAIINLYKNQDKEIVSHIQKTYIFHKVKGDGNCF